MQPFTATETREAREIMYTLESELSRVYSVASADLEYTYNAIGDNLLQECKGIIFVYLNDPSGIQSIPSQDLALLYEFLLLKSDYLRAVKTSLGITDSLNLPIIELGKSIELFKEHKTLSKKSDECLYTKIDNNITHLQSELTFCYSVFSKIIQERNIFRN